MIVFKIAAGIALGILLIGIVVLILLTLVIVWSKLAKRIKERLDDYDVQDDYQEDEYELSEIENAIRHSQKSDEIWLEMEKDRMAAEEAQRIRDWFKENDIEMWEDK